MTNYSKTTNFTAKDSLVSGDANKIVKGSEIDVEFDNIATASATKANIASPVFTGVVSFPDGSAGDPSITNTGDTNTGLFFSAADTLSFTAAGTAQFTMGDGVIAPVTDADVDLGTSSLEFKDAYFDGTVHTDAINLNGTAITSTAAELNILDGVTSTAAEINLLDGVTATTTELNYTDTGAAVGVVVASKVVTADANKDVASFRNITLTGELDAGSLDISGDADIDGTLETDALSINGTAVTSTAAELNILDGVTSTAAELNILDGKAFLDEDDMSSNSATGIASQQSIKAYVDAQITAEDLDFQADSGGALSIDLDSETLTFTGGTGVDTSGSGNAVTFAIDSTVATLTGSQTLTNKSLTAPTLTGTAVVASLDISGDIDVDGTANLDVVDIDGALTQDGGAVFNEAGADVDFRVESDGNANMLFVDGENNRVGIGTSSPSAKLEVDGAASTDGILIINPLSGSFYNAKVEFRRDSTAGGAKIQTERNSAGGVGLSFNVTADNTAETNGTYSEAMTVDRSGNVIIGSTGGTLQTATAGTSNFRAGVNAGNSITSGGNFNVVVGDEAGTALTTGDNNVALGFEALKTEDTSGSTTAIGYQALRVQNSGGSNSHNSAVGAGAGTSITTGNQNTIFGSAAADALTDADFNVAMGYNALSSDTLGSTSTALGTNTLATQNFTTATDTLNTAVGYNAGTSVTTGVNNTIIGGLAGDALTSGNSNVAIGKSALSADTLGDRNVAIGFEALLSQNFTTTTDAFNTAVGHSAGKAVTTGIENTLVGARAGDALTDADFNVALGYFSLSADTLGSQSTAIGYATLSAQNFTTATTAYNVAVGSQAGNDITTGVNNVLVGALAGDAMTDADFNVAVGTGALGANTTGSRSVAVGEGALLAQNPATATNMYNTALGFNAGNDVTTGANNTLIGGLAGDALTDSTQNTVVGYGALSADTSGRFSTAVGYLALQDQNLTTTTNVYNVAVGHSAGKDITTGLFNTIVGGLAGDVMTTGTGNTFIGYNSAGSGNVTEDFNTAVGISSGQNLTSGGNNLLLGRDAGITGSPGGNLTTQSNEIVFGDENITEAHIQVALTVASDERDKTDFVDLDLGLNFVKALEPVTYYWDKRSKYGDKSAEDYDLNAQTPDGTHKEDWMDIGFKAQSVQALEEAAGYKIADKKNLTVSLSGDGKQYGLRYEKFIPILVKAIKDQDAIITALTARIEALES